ncbi:MAG: multifunctional CCA addition/repair protein [Steroidobacteraceae bacterium]
MQVYLVGGAVRDALLGLQVKERDYVVVGARAEELTAAGYKPVGRDFPVFLHPETHAEHALARRERKTGPGYRGFVTEFSPDITLEEDLLRRDLTINAMAQRDDGTLVDPYGGQRDLAARVLRHVSPAFAEDPVRILRIARFAARFAGLGFTVHAQTLQLMRGMVDAGEADALVPERVWQETERALGEARPDVFFTVLRDCGALKVIFPEVDALFGVPQPAQWHPEIDTGVHLMMCLRRAAELDANGTTRFAVLAHDLGKGATPPDQWPKHVMHEARGLALVDALCARLKVPVAHKELARMTCKQHTNVHRALQLRPDTVLRLLEDCDAFRRPERFRDMLLACQCDAQGRKNLQDSPYPQREYLDQALRVAAAVQLDEQQRASLKGPAFAAALRARRLAALAALRPAVS